MINTGSLIRLPSEITPEMAALVHPNSLSMGSKKTPKANSRPSAATAIINADRTMTYP